MPCLINLLACFIVDRHTSESIVYLRYRLLLPDAFGWRKAAFGGQVLNVRRFDQDPMLLLDWLQACAAL